MKSDLINKIPTNKIVKTAVTITIECMPNNVDNVIATLTQEGWMKDENLHEITMIGKVKFIMWRYIDNE